MTEQKREREALQAYFRLLEAKGAQADDLETRQMLIEHLLPLLAKCPLEASAYRQQVDSAITRVEKAQWPAFLAIVREYFYFWMNDIKGLAALNAAGGIDVRLPAVCQMDNGLQQMWQRLESESFSVAENWPIKAYTAALRSEGAEKSIVETRIKLVRLLTLQLRDVKNRDARQYRTVVDAMLPLFSANETRFLFQLVVREFYYFWIGDPEAPAHLTLAKTES